MIFKTTIKRQLFWNAVSWYTSFPDSALDAVIKEVNNLERRTNNLGKGGIDYLPCPPSVSAGIDRDRPAVRFIYPGKQKI
jgi:hypothetical protein